MSHADWLVSGCTWNGWEFIRTFIVFRGPGNFLLDYFDERERQNPTNMSGLACTKLRLFGFACIVLGFTPAALFFTLGGIALSQYQQYQNEATGKQVGLHVDARRDEFGYRYFVLIEEYTIVKEGFNCSVSTKYNSRVEAEEDMVRHAIGHAYLSLHVHDSTCMTNSDWKELRYNGTGMTVGGVCFFLVAACCAAAYIENTFVHDCRAHEQLRRNVFAAGQRRALPTAEDSATETSSVSDESSATETLLEMAPNSRSGLQVYREGFREGYHAAQVQLTELLTGWSGREPTLPSFLPGTNADAAK
jgi:hypothetical protein